MRLVKEMHGIFLVNFASESSPLTPSLCRAGHCRGAVPGKDCFSKLNIDVNAGHAQLPTIHRIPVIGHHRAESSSDQPSQNNSMGRASSLKGPATPRRAPIRAPALAPSPGQADPLAEETVVDLTTPRVTSPRSSK